MKSILAFLLTFFPSFSWGQVVLEDDFTKMDLNKYSQIFITTTDTSIQEVLLNSNFQKTERWTFGLSSDYYWLKIRIRNLGSSKKIYFEFHYPQLEHVEMYSITQGDNPILLGKAGMLVPLDKKLVKHRQILLPLVIEAKSERDIYLKVKSAGSINLKGSIWLDSALINDLDDRSLILSLYYGSMLAMLFYNFVLYLSTRDKTFLFYCLYLLSSIVFFAAWNGIGAQYLWTSNPSFTKNMMLFSSMQIIVWIMAFSLKYLDLPRYSSKLTLICKIIIFTSLAFSIFIQFLSHAHALLLMIISIILSSIFALLASTRIWAAGSQMAKIYLLAGSLLIIGSILGGLSISNTIPMTNIGLYAAQLGCALDAIFLSFGLGLRLNYLEKEKYAIEKKMVHTLNDKLHFFSQLKKVFYTHQIDLIETGVSLESTMPTEQNEAAVIVFDIISSSSLNHENTKDFIRSLFNRCYQTMMENYDPKERCANAYRIKELGDGFLCSVGYPFKTPHGKQKSITALALIDRFTAIFAEEVKNFDYPLPIYFSIGVALGEIHGFYPEVGPKEYDLFGDAIMLATRYESMRNQILKENKKSSIIILQERFFYSLPHEIRSRFIVLDLDKYDLQVRDDVSAKRLYYWLLSPSEEQDQINHVS